MFVDVQRRTSIVHTAVEFTMKISSAIACSGSNGLQIRTHEQRRTQHALSAILEAALLSRTADKKWTGILSPGSEHRGHGTLPIFRQPRRARRTTMKGRTPIRRDRDVPRLGEHDEANSASEEVRMALLVWVGCRIPCQAHVKQVVTPLVSASSERADLAPLTVGLSWLSEVSELLVSFRLRLASVHRLRLTSVQ